MGDAEDIFRLGERSDLNVLFILVDTLRADRLGCYGYSRSTSPVIDSLASTGIRFSNHASQSSWTKCSMASLWTGLNPQRSGVTRAQQGISEDATLPAEIFRDAGFRTAGLWRNGWIAPNFGFGQGFEIYHHPPSGIPLDIQKENPEKVAGSDADVIRSAAEFFRAHADERWFLYLHLMDVHQYTYDEESALFGSAYSDVYDNSIAWTDSLIGHLMDELTLRGLRDNTLIVLLSDHGEAFGEHGSEGHARDVYSEVTSPPWIISLPFRLEPGIIVDDGSSNVDVWPTLLALLGLPGLDEPDGRPLVAELKVAAGLNSEVESSEGTAYRFAQLDANWAKLSQPELPLVAIEDDRWRLLYNGAAEGRVQLFDRSIDPGELVNVASGNPDVVKRLQAELEAYLGNRSAPWGGEAPVMEIDEMQLQHLRAIGYGIN